ncbi:MAG: DHH family phosphoesterase [Deltaproteobacteria bacterium]|nr:MAG: DHH family phosphoesterase [Deltaproteobacteria bacterium]
MSPTRSRQDRLRELYKAFNSKDKVLITICADPDSLASAMALKRLLWRKVKGVTITHFNEIKRFDNLTMIRLLKIPLVKPQRLRVSDFTKTVLVDGQPNHSESFAGLKFDVIIDHHPLTQQLQACFVDIRPRYGSTATIMTEYLQAAKIRPSKSLATAIIFAIKVDTGNFESGVTEEDIKAFRYLFPYADMNLLRKIEMADMQTEDLEYFRRALENKEVIGGKIFTHLGQIESPDNLVQVADFFMRLHEIAWVVVSGVYRKTLVVVIRNDGFRKDAGAWTNRAFGRFGSAGGRRSRARAEIPLTDLQEHLRKDDPTDLGRFVIRQFKKGGGSR